MTCKRCGQNVQGAHTCIATEEWVIAEAVRRTPKGMEIAHGAFTGEWWMNSARHATHRTYPTLLELCRAVLADEEQFPAVGVSEWNPMI